VLEIVLFYVLNSVFCHGSVDAGDII